MVVYGVFCCLKSTLIIVLLAKREQLLAATETFSATPTQRPVWERSSCGGCGSWDQLSSGCG